MCGRYGYTLKESEEEFNKRFEIESNEIDLSDNWNAAPMQKLPIVERHSPNSVHIRTWGVMPGWSKMLLINAKKEKLATSRFWKASFTTSRCIIPAEWFYEWQKLPDGKQPFVIRLKSKEMFGFAGLLMTVHDKEGKEQTGFVIITTEPNEVMKPIHDRMPVILLKEDEEAWLNPDNTEPEMLLDLLKQYPTEEMEAYPVSSLVNTTKNNFPELLKPASSQPL